MKPIKGLLFDIGGVLYVGNKVINGAPRSIKMLHQHFPMRFVTNTTRTLPGTIIGKLRTFGFDIHDEELFTALDVTRNFLLSQHATVLPVMTDEAESYFKELFSERPDYVVVGDAHTNFDYPHLNRAFRALMDGASLIAAARNKYFKDEDGKLSLDAGGFIGALEYASGKKARTIGKPSQTFFHLAVASMGLQAHEVLIVGDDIESDIKGAQDAGLQAALVKTGKFQASDLEKGIRPELILDDMTQLVDYLLK
ncbi:TIGR01458 family HAD-type hydrolase [Sulfurovum sp.]|uniref:TIGR01458 family HAD-type hydrolase n=1 Tax=Sulfurovum sp. TaxID=1969726 RepID=UPI0025D17616|nr:TIGR01458 family HAD-type hydrolase [Sulfurovum sp.]